MKSCPTCGNTYEDSVGYCPRDGEVLEESPTDIVGQVLDGQYEIQAFIARGGMGALYRARHIMLGDAVVIKTLRTEMRQNSEWLRRFQREGRAARRFRHPNAVTVYDLRSTAEGLIYMVMEYVDGYTLDKELKRRERFTPTEALEVLEPVASVLDAAHAQGVVHRDLKPENVMINRTGEHLTVKLLDLGIAKLRDVAESKVDESGSSLTVIGQILGTPYYMSPEQWGELPRDGSPEIDGRADIYSLGVMFYELVTGNKPIVGQSLPEVRQGHVMQLHLPLHEVAPDVPEGFARAIDHAMAKDRNDRPATAGEFIDELRASLGLSPMPRATPALLSATQPDLKVSQSDLRDKALTSGGHPSVNRSTQPAHILQTVASSAAAGNSTDLSATAGREQASTPPLDAPSPRHSRAPLIAGLSISLLLAIGVAVTAGGWYMYHRLNANRVSGGTATNTSKSINADANVVAAAEAETISYWLEAYDSAHKGAGRRVANTGDLTLASGQQFKFHFRPRQRGYLYIIGPGQGNAPTTFLTAQPMIGILKTNQLVAGSDFAFPYGEGQVIQLDKNPGTEEYTVVFSPTPLMAPTFFTAKALHELTPAEVKEFEDFRKAHKTGAPVISVKELNAGQPVVSVSQSDGGAQGQPLFFDVRIEHR